MVDQSAVREGSGVSRRFKAALIVGWLVATVPLMDLGYGSDVDAWLVAQRAGEIWTTGRYARSRSTGFPLYELTATPLVEFGGWRASNAIALVSGLTIMFLLFQLASDGALRRPAMTITGFMFLPVIIKNATSTMDYLPALSLLLGSYLALQRNRAIWCAALIGIACGIRPSSLLFVVPCATAAWIRFGRRRTPLLMLLTSAVVGLIGFSPSLLLGPVRVSHSISALMGGYTAMRLLGLAQTAVVGTIAAGGLWAARGRIAGDTDERMFATFHAVNLVIWLAAFALLPGEPEYLLAAAISFMLLLDRYTSGAMLATAVVALLSYHVVALKAAGSHGGLRRPHLFVGSGFTVDDVNERRFMVWQRLAANAWHPEQPTLFMEQILPPTVGNPEWIYDWDLNIYRQVHGNLAVSERLTAVEALKKVKARGYRVIVWRAREWQYLTPATVAAHALVEFVDDPGVLFGVPVRGTPLLD